MKRIICLFLLFAACLSFVFTLTACSEDFVIYVDYNIKFGLPKEFKKKNEQWFDIVFTTEDVRFQVDVISKEDVEKNEDGAFGFHVDSTVEDFANIIIDSNSTYGMNVADYKYDEERNISLFYAIWWPDEEDESHLYYFIAGKGEHSFFLATFMCPESMKDEYLPLFTEWSSYIEIME